MTDLRQILQDATAADEDALWATSAEVRHRGDQVRRRRRTVTITAPLAALVALASTSIVWWPSGRGVPVRTTTSEPPAVAASACSGQPPGCGTLQGAASALSGGTWAPISAGPLGARDEQASVWTGTDLIIWGGAAALVSAARSPVLADGAAFDPATGAWSLLPSSPLAARQSATAVAADGHMIIWGGANQSGGYFADGASYEPATRHWSPLPTGPLSAREDATSLWTGTQMIIFGGHNSTGLSLGDAATYTPATREWQLLPARPTPPHPDGSTEELVDTTGAWTGSQLVVVDTYTIQSPCGTGCVETKAVTAVNEWTPRTETWRSLPPPPTQVTASSATAVWTGRNVLLTDGNICLSVESCPVGTGGTDGELDLSTGAWTVGDELHPSPRGPLVWTGTALVAFDAPAPQASAGISSTDQVLAFDPNRGTWTELPSLTNQDISGSTAAWTGRQLIVWSSGSVENTSGPQAWVLTPTRPG